MVKAEDKTTKAAKATKVAPKKAAKPAKKDAKATKAKKLDLSKMSLADLQTELASKHDSLLEQKRSHQSGELVNPKALAHTRKEVARLQTAISGHLNAAKAEKYNGASAETATDTTKETK